MFESSCDVKLAERNEGGIPRNRSPPSVERIEDEGLESTTKVLVGYKPI